jgi:hypothetical protein
VAAYLALRASWCSASAALPTLDGRRVPLALEGCDVFDRAGIMEQLEAAGAA